MEPTVYAPCLSPVTEAARRIVYRAGIRLPPETIPNPGGDGILGSTDASSRVRQEAPCQ